ncbi:MAG: hypothetical protein WB626_12835 [Bacteroidota bacterium]
MKHHLLVFLTPVLIAGLFQACNEPTSTQPAGSHPPLPSPGLTPVHLAVGNTYNWWLTRMTGTGTWLQWREFSTITDDTTLLGRIYYIFDSGERLRSAGDTVFAFLQDTPSVYYRFDVSVGDSIPFMGSTCRVTAIDTQTVLGDTQVVVSVFNLTVGSNLTSGRYASRFGVIRIDTRESLSVTTRSLQGARLGNWTFGVMP